MKYVKSIELGDDEQGCSEVASGEAMTPQAIADQLKQIDPHDLDDLVIELELTLGLDKG